MVPDGLPLLPADGGLVPAWLGPGDHAWLEALLDELARCEGQPVRVWRARAKEPLRAASPERARRFAADVLERLCQADARVADPPPAELRARLYAAAQEARDRGDFDRERVVASIGIVEVESAMFADLPAERRLVLPNELPTPPALAQLVNAATARRLLRSATSVEITLIGRCRAVVRQVALKRLLCTVHAENGEVRIAISGPLALFRRTTLYGRALASVLPVLRGAERFELTATCQRGGRSFTVRIRSGDPVFPPGPDPARHDSQLEARFARDLARLAPDWDLIREPEPVRAGDAWIFPDFAIVHRRDPSRRLLVELVGFWTRDYLARKLDGLARAGRRDILVCVDQALGCDESALDLPVLGFRRRVDAGAVAALLPGPATVERVGTEDLFLDWAGRQPPEDGVHARLAAMAPGAEVRLVDHAGRSWVVGLDGLPLAVLSGPARTRWLGRLGSVRGAWVREVVERQASQSAPAYRAALRVEHWRLPVVEIALIEGPRAPPAAGDRAGVDPHTIAHHSDRVRRV